MLIGILFDIMLPIFLLIGVGFVLDRCFPLDQPTLSRLNFYVFVPALIFMKLLEAELAGRLMLLVGSFAVAHVALLYLSSRLLFSRDPFKKNRTTLMLGSMFFNAGNYGIPLTLLAFGEQMLGVIAVVLMVQNFLSFTLGVGLLEHRAGKPQDIMRRLLRIPVVPAIILALLLRTMGLQPPTQLATPLNYLADGLIPVALLTLGVQLSRSMMAEAPFSLSAVISVRLALSPVLAAFLVWAMRIPPPVSAVLIVSAGLPVAVNVYILSAEYRQNQKLAALSVFWTTLLSAVTVPLLLVLVH